MSKNIKLTKKQNLDLNIWAIFIKEKTLDSKILTIKKLFEFNIWLLTTTINFCITFRNKILLIVYFDN